MPDTDTSRWARVEGVTCVVCPGCGFTYAAEHELDRPEGGYACPNCSEGREPATAFFIGHQGARMVLSSNAGDRLVLTNENAPGIAMMLAEAHHGDDDDGTREAVADAWRWQ